MNKHIESYLDFYLNLNKPKFAILIDGKWGAGKTHFIKTYFDKKGSDYKYLYVSLNGISKTEEIEDQFFEQLHPFLNSKMAKITGKVLKGILKTSLHIDLNGDNKNDGSVSLQLPDIKLSEDLRKAGNRILVFDDLERIAMPPKEILGYINQFVEHEGQKVIIVGNEEKLVNEKQIQKIKEKVIGRTFYVNPEFNKSIECFFREVHNPDVAVVLFENRKEIEYIFYESNSKNLRLLRYGIIEFELFYRKIEFILKRSTNTSDFFVQLLKLFFMFTFEFGSGTLTKADFSKFEDVMSGRHLASTIENETVFNILKRYKNLDFQLLISEGFWREYFVNGIFKKEIFLTIEKNPKYFQAEKPLWYKLWNFYDLRDAELSELLIELEGRKSKRDFNSLEEIFHLTSTSLELIEIGILKRNKNNVINGFQLIAEDYINSNQEYFFKNHFRFDTSYMGAAIKSYTDKDYKDFTRKVNDFILNNNNILNKKLIAEIQQSIYEDVNLLRSKITAYEKSRRKDYTFFENWDLEELVSQFQQKSSKERREIINIFIDRIDEFGLTESDKKWLQQLIWKLKNEFSEITTSIEHYAVSQSIVVLNRSLKKSKVLTIDDPKLV